MKCVWKDGTPCCGSVSEEKLFMNQIKVPICEHHLRQAKLLADQLKQTLPEL